MMSSTRVFVSMMPSKLNARVMGIEIMSTDLRLRNSPKTSARTATYMTIPAMVTFPSRNESARICWNSDNCSTLSILLYHL